MKFRTCLAAALVFALPSIALAADPVAGLGTALNLESSRSEGAEITDNAALDVGTGSFTIEAWIKRTSVTDGFYTIAGKQDSAGWYFRLNGHTLNFTAAFNASSGNGVSAASDITDTDWHHVVGVHDASAKTVAIYIDGVLSNSAAYSSAANVDNNRALGIGFKPGWGEYFNGSLDDVRFWNTARTAAQIREYMRTPLAGNESGLVGYWNFEEGSGTSTANRTGTSGLDATLQNSDSDEWITGNIPYNATTNEDINVSLRLGGSDADSQSSATAVITDLPDHGVLRQTNDGSTIGTQISATGTALNDSGGNPRRVIFVPTANYSGSDTFSYKVNDGSADSGNTVTVNLSIASVADAPTATNLTQSKTATEAGSAVALDDIVVADGDSGDTITATLTLSSTTAGTLSTGTYGSATSTFNAGTGVWTVTGSVADVNAALAAVAFTPSANNDQNFTITTRIRDAASTGPADGTISVTVTAVNDNPGVSGMPTSLSFTEDESLASFDISASAFSDVDSANITVTVSVSAGLLGLSAPGETPVTLGGNGTASITIAGAVSDVNLYLDTGSNVKYTPAANANGTPAATATVTVNDGNGSGNVAAGSIDLNVTAVNDAPVLTSGGALSAVNQDTASPAGAALNTLGIVANDTADSGTISGYAIVANAANATTQGAWQYSTNAGANWHDVRTTVSGSAALKLSPVTLVRFLPVAGYSGTPGALTIRALDGNVAGFSDGSATETRQTMDTTTNGGTTSISAATASITTSVTDTVSPAVTSVSVPSNATYVANQNLDFTVNWSEAVTVDTTGGTPRIALTIGSTARSASFVSGSGSTALLFRYTTQASDFDDNGITVGALALDSGTLKDSAGNNATLTLNSVGSTAGVNVDAVAPSVTARTVPADSTYKTGAHLDFTVTYSENVTVSTGGGTPYIAVTLSTGGSVQAAYNGGTGTATLTFRYTVASGNVDADGIAAADAITLNGGTIRDGAGNNAQVTTLGFATTAGVLVDGVAPTVSTSNRQSPSASRTNATSVTYRVTFSESVTGVDTADFTLTATGTANGSVASVSAASATVYDVTVNTVSGDGTLRLDLKSSGTGIADSATNAIATGYTSGQTYTIDNTASGVTSVGVPGNATYLANQNLDFTVNWNESVTVDTAGGTPAIALTIGSTARSATYLSGSPGTALTFRYTVQSGDLDANGISVGALALNSGTIRDSAGNDATLTLNSVGSTAGVNVDAVAPSVTARTVPADSTYKTGANLDFTVTYSENVTVSTGGGTPYIAVTLSTGGSVQAAYNGGTGTATLTFRYTIASGNLDADGIAAADAITLNGGTIKDGTGNDAQVSSLGFGSTAAVLVDAVAPSVSTIARQAPATATTNAASVVYRVTFSESVTGVDTADFTLTVTGSAAGTIASLSGSGATYDVTVNAVSGAGTLRLDLKTTGTGIADSATNAIGTAGFTSGETYTRDTTAPAVSSIVRQTPTTVHTDATSATWRVTFDEGVTGVDTADFALTSVSGTGTGSIASVTSVSTTVYDVAVSSLTGQRTLRLDLNASGTGIADTAGNAVSGGFTSGEFFITGLPSVFQGPGIGTGTQVYGVSAGAGNKVAQRFTTSAASATTLKSVAARVVTLSAPTPLVTINANNAGAPGAVVGTLTNPATLTGGGALNVWTGNIQLTAGTTYWIVFAADAGNYDIARASATSGGEGDWLGVSDYAVRYSANLTLSASDVTKIALGATSVPAITSTLTASGTVGATFSYSITASNTPTSYAATGLPAGLSVNTATGAITGTPTTAGTSNVTLTATNGSGTGAASTLVVTIASAGGGTSDPGNTSPNPFNPGGTQAQTNLDPATGVVPTRAPNDIVTNIGNLDNRVGISDNGVVVVLDNGLREPVKFRDNPPDNVLISMPSQKPLDVQLNGNTLNILVDPETPNPPKQTLLGTTTLLLPDGSQTKGLQLVQGEAAIGNDTPGAPIGGMELSKDTTLRSVVAQSGQEGGTAGFRKGLDGAGSVSAESGEVRITVRLKGTSGIAALSQAMTLPGFGTQTVRTATADIVTLTLKAGEVARFNTLGELDGVFLGSLSGSVGKTGDTLAMAAPAGVAAYPASTLVFDGGNVPARIGLPFSDFLNAQLAGQLHFVQRGDGLMEVTSPGGGKFYARTFGRFEVLPDAADGPSANGDGSLSLTYGGIRSTWQPMLEDAADLAAYFTALGGYVTEVLENGNVQLSGSTSHFFVARPRHGLRSVFSAAQGIAPVAPADSSLFYTNARGQQQQLDPAFHDEAQVRLAAAAQGWTLARSGLGGNNLTVTSPDGVVYQVVPDLRVDVLETDDGFSGLIRREGGKLYFYYADEALRQGFTLKAR